MTLGTIAVIVVLALIVGAIVYSQIKRRIKAKKAGVPPHCSACSSSASCAQDKGSDDDANGSDGQTPTGSCH
ncbi:MAG: hypothetical protein LBL23_07555 [Coriobacteriales bacterium]|jgi:hypothetical protein|nr:hypothetical protein [Coriobacteriales bacterium]